MAEIQEDCRRLANVETGEKETPLGEKETPLGEKVGEKVNFVGEKKIIGVQQGPQKVPSKPTECRKDKNQNENLSTFPFCGSFDRY